MFSFLVIIYNLIISDVPAISCASSRSGIGHLWHVWLRPIFLPDLAGFKRCSRPTRQLIADKTNETSLSLSSFSVLTVWQQTELSVH